MELIIRTLMFFIVINVVLKLSFWKGWQTLLYGLVCAVFILWAEQWAILQSKTQLADYLSYQNILQNAAVLVTLESIAFISYCFLSLSRLGSKKKRRQFRTLHGYPGFLIFPVLFYILTQSIFSFPGSDFGTISQILAGAVFLAFPLAGYGMKRLLPEREFRLEVLFLVSCVGLALGLLSTVNGHVIYAPSPMSSNLKAIAGTFILFSFIFSAGFILNRTQWKVKQKNQKKYNQ